ncbi:MAG: PKD domain-containing protein, partial [Balneolaceae bacterium]
NVTTWDHINAPTVSDWTTTVCTPEGSIGLDADWVNPHNAFNIRPLLDGGLHAFEKWFGGIHSPSNFGEAEWINSMYARKSLDMNPDGQGHNWTKYETEVSGNGDFVVKLLADNCSWIYLDGEIIGYQDDAGLEDANNVKYGVQLDGTHTLSFIIYDGGGDAGGKFRLETTNDPPPPFIPSNTAPVADAGSDQTLEATGPTTSVTVDGSASSDADGDELSYSWTLNGNEVSTSVTATEELGLGTHTFTLTVSDGTASDSDEVTITVEDTTPPELSFTVETTELWAPNHKMHLVVSGISATDLAGLDPDLDITVTSNESANGRGDGNTNQDWNVVDNGDGTFDVYVLAERSGQGEGRIYTITMTATDTSGNSTQEMVEVTVPHDKKGNTRGR